MSLTIFLAICVIGCDVLIYFLFQWTLGEKRRTKRRRIPAGRATEKPLRQTELFVVRAPRKKDEARLTRPAKAGRARVRVMQEATDAGGACDEESVYRRRLAAFAGSR